MNSGWIVLRHMEWFEAADLSGIGMEGTINACAVDDCEDDGLFAPVFVAIRRVLPKHLQSCSRNEQLRWLSVSSLSQAFYGLVLISALGFHLYHKVNVCFERKADVENTQSVPSGDEPSRRLHTPSINKSLRSLNENDLLEVMIKLQGRSEVIFVKR